MNYHENQKTILSFNDGNHVNGDAPIHLDVLQEVKCGYCGEIQEDSEKKFCNACERDEFIRNYIKEE